MPSLVERFRAALRTFDQGNQFTEADYEVLCALVGARRRQRRAEGDLLEGLVNLFFERHLMSDVRRTELIAMDDAALERAVSHRFHQVLADAQEENRPYRALRAQVRAALDRMTAVPAAAEWPTGLRERNHFASPLVEAAVDALARERGALPTPSEATSELFRRYAVGEAEPEESQDVPEAIRRRIDGQRLAAGILRLLTPEERQLLRHVLEDGAVEDWALSTGCSRATAYRMLARLKALCRLEFAQRSNRTQLEALQALRGGL